MIADIAQATGLPQKAIREHLDRAALADGVLGIILAGLSTRARAEDVASTAGVTKEELSSAVVRYHDAHRREQVATQVAYRSGTRKRHVPVGEPPSTAHRWCKRGSHWVHQDDMAKNRSRADGYGDWCKPCWREYWAKHVQPKQKPRVAAVTDPGPCAHAFSALDRTAPTGWRCVSCGEPVRVTRRGTGRRRR